LKKDTETSFKRSKATAGKGSKGRRKKKSTEKAEIKKKQRRMDRGNPFGHTNGF